MSVTAGAWIAVFCHWVILAVVTKTATSLNFAVCSGVQGAVLLLVVTYTLLFILHSYFLIFFVTNLHKHVFYITKQYYCALVYFSGGYRFQT